MRSVPGGPAKAVVSKSHTMIIYALIARGKTVLAEFTGAMGNFPQITRVLLGKVGFLYRLTFASLRRFGSHAAPVELQIQVDRDGKMTYMYDNHVFHYVVEEGIIYMAMCDDGDGQQKRRIPFTFLDDVSSATCESSIVHIFYVYPPAISGLSDASCFPSWHTGLCCS